MHKNVIMCSQGLRQIREGTSLSKYKMSVFLHGEKAARINI